VLVLARMLAKDPLVIHTALQDLDTNDFIQCYEVSGKLYYHITRWDEWETLNKPARSRYPAPPEADIDMREMPEKDQENPGKSQVFSESPALSGKFLSEAEEKRREAEAEAEETPENIVPFPARADGDKGKSEETITSELAQVLHVPVTSALVRLVAEFQHAPGLSLLGEANAARAWVDDQRNKRKKQTPMTLPFFRRWLQRSLTINADQAARASREMTRATGTSGPSGPARLPDLMHLDDDVRKGKIRQ